MTAIRANLTKDIVTDRNELKAIISEETGVPFGRISDHIFFRVAVRFLVSKFSHNRRIIIELFKEEIDSHQSTFGRKKRS